MSSEEEEDRNRHGIEDLLTRQVECRMIASAQWSVESFLSIEEQKTPFNLLDRQFTGLDAKRVKIGRTASSVSLTHR
jgi:hypothetical protein